MTDQSTPPSAVRTMVGALLTLPAIGILLALAAGLVSGTTALLMLFFVTGGQFDDGHWTWYVGFAAFYGLYGVLMVGQEVALARHWMSERSAAFEAIERFFGGFKVG